MFTKKVVFTVIFVFLSLGLQATTFIPHSVDHQLKNSEGVVLGTYIGKNYKKTKDGEIVTEAIFSIEKVAGINPNQIINSNAFRVTLPGGKWNGVVYHFSGVPKFKKNEKVILILNKGNFGYQLSNLALSKFAYQVSREGTWLQSEVFPNRPGVGKIKLKEFESLIERNYGSQLKVVGNDRYIYKGESFNKKEVASVRRGQGREPASLKKKQVEEESSKVEIIWLILILGALGGTAAASLRRNED